MTGSAVRDIRLDTHVHVPFFIPVRVTASRIERIAASRPAVTCRLPVVQFFPPASAFLHAHHFGIFLFLLPARSAVVIFIVHFPPSLLDPYPWIHDAQNDIGQQCGDDCHEPVEQDQDVRHTEVTCRYGIQEQPAHARVAVDHFYKDRAAEQCHDFITEESCNRKYGISEYMPAVYRRLLHTFGPGQDDEILLFRFNDAAPEILYRAHQADQRDGETRQHQMIDLAEYKVEGPRFYAGAD